MAIYAGETGRTIRLNAGFDMSANTDVRIIFVTPGGEVIEKASADGVQLIGVGATDPVLGALAANEYVEFEATPDLFQVPGIWRMYIEYENHSVEPAENIFGDTVKLTVKPRAETVAAEGGVCG